jgi:biopolymer transport protein ExbB
MNQSSFSFFNTISHGGFMMIPLLLSALIALTVIFERFYLFQKSYSLSKSEIAELTQSLKAGNFAHVKKISEAGQSPITAILKTGTDTYGMQSADLEQAMNHEAQRWIPVLEKRLEILDTVITAAPLMGLLGTITGMMASFQILSTSGVNEPNAITGGVAEALIATATGLVIALFSLVAYNYFNSRVKFIVQTMESMANLLLDAKTKGHALKE